MKASTPESRRPPVREVSVIVPCRNEAPHLSRFLESVLRQDLAGIDLEIIIADGMSDDGTRGLLKHYGQQDPRIRLIDNPQRIASTGLNAAIRAARGGIIIRMDAHTEYAPDYVRRCVELLVSTGADNVGGPPRVRPAGPLTRLFGAAFHSTFAVGGSKSHDTTYEGYIDSVCFGCWRKSTLEQIGLFDEALVRNQDDELNLRLTRLGGKVWQSPSIVSWYQPRVSLHELFRQYFQYGFWKVPVILKHRLPASWRHLVPGLFVLANLVLVLASAGAFAAGSRAWLSWSLSAWGLLLAVYGLACIVAALGTVGKNGWLISTALPLVFPVYHVSYGTGFLIGLLYWRRKREPQAPRGRLFTEITR